MSTEHTKAEDSDENARRDLLWGMYVDVRAHARHAETLRANTVALVVVLGSALIALIASDRTVDHGDTLLAALIIVLGVVGLLFSLAYTELFQRNRSRAIKLRDALDARYFATSGETIHALLKASDDEHQANLIHRLARKRTGSATTFWIFVPTLIVIVGASLAGASLR